MKPAKTLTPEGLKQARQALGLTRTQLAELMGVDYLTVRRWEQPKVIIPRMAEVAFTAVMWIRRQELDAMTVDEAIKYARKHGMKVEERDYDGWYKVTYPSGESELVEPGDGAAKKIVEITFRML